MKNDYQPLKGSTVFRAIEHLKRLPEGAELPTVPLCEAIDAEPSCFSETMQKAVQAGLVRTHRATTQGRPHLWSLGNGMPDLPLDYRPDEKLPHTGDIVRTGVGMLLPGVTGREPKPILPDFKAALWTDGSLIMVGVEVRADGTVILGAKQTAQIRKLVAWTEPA